MGGLRPGNVRYAGINVGTVERLSIMNDSTVQVDIALREDHRPTSAECDRGIGSDGLMGTSS
ncbi:MAG: hypothetical protein IPF41_05390 [Flavobacteriales bacterium]|nr:hypothetical protein [Flavobacteriales bacterium]